MHLFLIFINNAYTVPYTCNVRMHTVCVSRGLAGLLRICNTVCDPSSLQRPPNY